MDINKIVEKFMELEKKETALTNALSLMYWDGVTGAPKKGAELRAFSSGIISGEIFQIINCNKMKKYSDLIISNRQSVDDVVYYSALDIKNEQKKLEKISKKDYSEFAEICSKAELIWEEAKEENSYKKFKPYFEKIVEMQKKFIKQRGYTSHPYDTLLDDYEQGITVAELDKFFEKLKAGIIPIVKSISNKNRKKFIWKNRRVPVEVQKKFNTVILEHIGYDFNSGMFAESEHPFTIGFGPSDVRITTHYYEENFISAIFSTIHEAGHAIYEQNIDKKYEGTRVATGVSMGVHESQSRLFENIFGRSREFWEPLFKIMIDYYGSYIGEVDFNEFIDAVNQPEFSKIRTEADELTYTLHIIIRYEIEKGIFDESIDIEKIEEVWNKKTKEYLGIETNSAAEGVLQDSHWAGGLFGYFPSYAIGNCYSAQIAKKLNRIIDLKKELKAGNFILINKILKENIHKYGKVITPKQLMKNFIGEEINPDDYIDYLEKKFLK